MKTLSVRLNKLFLLSRESFFLPEAIPPIRLSLKAEESFYETGKNIALQKQDLPIFPPCLSQKRLAENNRLLLNSYQSYHLSNATARSHDSLLAPSTQWLMDNYYTINKSIQEVQRAFRGNFLHRLPLYNSTKKLPCIFVLGWFYVAWKDSNFSLSSFSEILRGYQSITTLQIAELWAIPEMLRFILIENSRRIAVKIEHNRRMRRDANNLADKIEYTTDTRKLDKLFSLYESLTSDVVFSNHLLYRLRNSSSNVATALAWIKTRFINAENLKELIAKEHETQTKDGITIRNIIYALNNINDVNWINWFEDISHVDAVLREKSDFSVIDFHSREAYRTAIAQIASRSPFSELDIARKALNLASLDKDSRYNNKKPVSVLKDSFVAPQIPWQKISIARYLIGNKREFLEKTCDYRSRLREKVITWYRSLKIWGIILPVSSLVLLILIMVFFLFLAFEKRTEFSIIFMFLAMFPVMEIAFSLFKTFVSCFIAPKALIGFEYEDGIPEEARTLVVIPTLLLSRHSISEDLRRLESHYLCNASGAINFALASDWKDAKKMESLEDLQLLETTRKGIADLNKRYSKNGKPIFFLFHRQRKFNKGEGVWMGWERKRGKLHELNLLLRGKKTSFFPHDSDLSSNFRFVLTVDSDTRLLPGTVAKMVGKLAHPVNRPVYDPKTGCVIEGYGILQPRVTPLLSNGEKTSLFQKIFSFSRGIDPYIFTTFDIYQDLIKEGTFVGKGLYEIDTFTKALQGKIKENSVLSHDLLEGGYARTAFVSDVEIMEAYPIAYGVDVARQHRWVRGDWQLLPYLLCNGQKINLAMAWKILDNLRRSLTPLAWIIASITGWCFLTLPIATAWQIFLLLSLSISSLLDFSCSFFKFDRYFMKRGHFYCIWKCFLNTALITFLKVTFLGHTAFYMSDAIFRSLYRMIISKKYLLEWRASATLMPFLRVSEYLSLMWPILPISFLILLLPFIVKSNSAPLAIPFCFLWFLSPFTAWFFSLHEKRSKNTKISLEDRMYLRRIARQTWFFYETFVSEKTNHLPPDNFQEQPQPLLARRTSPTNIGVYLLSVIAAREFGWISFSDTIKRIEQTLKTLEKLEKYQGHFFNWYSTDTLLPLSPPYVSTVDSGNLAGHLITLASTLKEWSSSLENALQSDRTGILDVSSILIENITTIAMTIYSSNYKKNTDVLLLLAKLKNALTIFQKNEIFEHSSSFLEKLIVSARHINNLTIEFERKFFLKKENLCVSWARSLVTTCVAHMDDLQKKKSFMADRERKIKILGKRLHHLAEKARLFAFSMKFDFLEQKERRLLSIGYRVQDNELDSSCYDLLASEARLAIFFAIAKGDIKIEHWFQLGRPLVPIGFKSALLSWSGSMFEYLMPSLVMRENEGSLLDQSNNLIIRNQISYARRHRLPWGISESAFNARDTSESYQYSSFGVPSLGLQPGLSNNIVIAPYASILAATYYPKLVIKNLHKLRSLGTLGPYGYYDAVDFTPSRLSEGEGQKYAVIYNYYAHHHGMSILAIYNTFLNKKMQKRFHRDPVVEAAEFLLQEKAPWEIPVIRTKRINLAHLSKNDLEKTQVQVISSPLNRSNTAFIMSSNEYHVMLTANGSGYSRWKKIAITRFLPDLAENMQGCFLFLRDEKTGRWWSATGVPTRKIGEETKTFFATEQVRFIKNIEGIKSTVECIVTNKAPGEARRIELLNTTNVERILTVTSYAEIALNILDRNDTVYINSSRIFFETETTDNGTILIAKRRKREPKDHDVQIAHFVTGEVENFGKTEIETNRYSFIGRGRFLDNPIVLDKKIPLSGYTGDVIDPVMAIRCYIRIPPKQKISLVFWTLVAPVRSVLMEHVTHYKKNIPFIQEFSATWIHAKITHYQIGVHPHKAVDYQQYTRYLIYHPQRFRSSLKGKSKSISGREGLCSLTISGDYPLFILHLDNRANDLIVLRDLLRANEYWSHHGLILDLVLISSHAQESQENIDFLCKNYRNCLYDSEEKLHIFTVRKEEISETVYQDLIACAQIVLHTYNGSLSEQLKWLEEKYSPFYRSFNKYTHVITKFEMTKRHF